VKSEVASRVGEMTKAPLEFAAKRRMQMAPTSWSHSERDRWQSWCDGLPVERDGWLYLRDG
jgi:hypothetical protein